MNAPYELWAPHPRSGYKGCRLRAGARSAAAGWPSGTPTCPMAWTAVTSTVKAASARRRAGALVRDQTGRAVRQHSLVEDWLAMFGLAGSRRRQLYLHPRPAGTSE
jgi:hypothetical protein